MTREVDLGISVATAVASAACSAALVLRLLNGSCSDSKPRQLSDAGNPPQEEEGTPATTTEVRPRRAVILDSVTTDRYIHYLLRPATALGAAEVIWLGMMRAKGELKGVGNYGRAMKSELVVPLTSLTTVFQARRRLSDLRVDGKDVAPPCIVGISWGPVSAASTGSEKKKVPTRSLIGFDASRHCSSPNVGLLFCGPQGDLTPEQVESCDLVLVVNPVEEGECIPPPPAFSALLSSVLYAIGRGLGPATNARLVAEKFTTKASASARWAAEGAAGKETSGESATQPAGSVACDAASDEEEQLF